MNENINDTISKCQLVITLLPRNIWRCDRESCTACCPAAVTGVATTDNYTGWPWGQAVRLSSVCGHSPSTMTIVTLTMDRQMQPVTTDHRSPTGYTALIIIRPCDVWHRFILALAVNDVTYFHCSLISFPSTLLLCAPRSKGKLYEPCSALSTWCHPFLDVWQNEFVQCFGSVHRDCVTIRVYCSNNNSDNNT